MGVGSVSGTGDSVADGMGVGVNVGRLVGEINVDEAGTTVGLALSVVEGVEGGGVNVTLC